MSRLGSHNCTEDLIDGIEATTQSSRNVDQVTGIFIFSYVIFGHTADLRIKFRAEQESPTKSQPRVVSWENIRFYSSKFSSN